MQKRVARESRESGIRQDYRIARINKILEGMNSILLIRAIL